MPRIIENGTNQLGRAAAGAAEVFLRERDRQDRLNREADRLGLAEREFELRKQNSDRNYDLAQKRAEQQGAVFERDMSQSQADTDYFRNLAIEDGADPAELEGMSLDGMRRAANILRLQRSMREGRERVGQLAQDTYSRLGFVQQEPMPDGIGAIDPQTGQPVQQAMDPFQERIELMMESAETPEDLEQIQALLLQANETSHLAEIEAQQRMSAVEMYTPVVEMFASELPNAEAAKLRTQLQMYGGGHIKATDFTRELNRAAQIMDKKNSGRHGLGPLFDDKAGLIRSAVDSGEMSFEEGNRRLDALGASHGFGQMPEQIEEQPETPSESPSSKDSRVQHINAGVSTFQDMSPGFVRIAIGRKAYNSIRKDAKLVSEDQRTGFVLERIKAIGLEKGLSRDQVADLTVSILSILDNES